MNGIGLTSSSNVRFTPPTDVPCHVSLCRGILNDQPFFLPFSESLVSTRLHKETEDSVLTHPSDNDILRIGMRRLENLRVRPCLSSNPVYSSSCFFLQQGTT
ncbi:conserved hypothetical protein [Ricinus communis]|uniref:Uncharacterized protein n=1 Tax=Ricinus communis TaxID=3988 RepID=B9RDB3_RICCO|nr:conserved hypothetical protein [Ricinus communis]